MPDLRLHFPVGPRSRDRLPRAIAVACCALITACDPPPSAPEVPTSPASIARSPETAEETTTANPDLAAARIDLARAALDRNAPDEALAMLVSALDADPSSGEALTALGELLAISKWHLPTLTIEHGQSIDHIRYDGAASLWVSLSGDANTMVRWNLDSLEIESVLFPVKAAATRSLEISPGHRTFVMERAGTHLLCDALTLKPICEIDPLPEELDPSSVIVFSNDDLLLGHPTIDPDDATGLIWRLSDATSGQIISSTAPVPLEQKQPVAASIDRQKLQVLHPDGSVLEVPISPAEEVVLLPPSQPVSLIAARYAIDGLSALTLNIPAPHQAPELLTLPPKNDTDESIDPGALIRRFPWSRQPNIWTSLFGRLAEPPLETSKHGIEFHSSVLAPVHTDAALTAFTAHGDLLLTGEENGTLIIHRTLPPPTTILDTPAPAVPDDAALTAIHLLSEALSATRYSGTTREFSRLNSKQRMVAYRNCDFEALSRILPALDFMPLRESIDTSQPRSAPPESLLPLWQRIANADSGRESWPSLLGKTEDLSHTPWHRQLTAALEPADTDELPDNPFSNTIIESTFESADPEAVLSLIQSSGTNGPAAAKCLELALASIHAEWISACLTHAEDLPPLLRKIAISRIAWIENRKADALTGWSEEFPDIGELRQSEDWDGWEQADFSQALTKLSLCVSEELAAIDVPDDPTPEQRKAIAARLSDPATMTSVGRNRFASACLKAALEFSAYPDETKTTFKLAELARNLGEPPARCLRAEALALTALGDYQGAHDRWIMLISSFPVEEQEPGDYAEASYTAFENANPLQAMQILTTGLHRFPNDANFALRAGWVALLTGNAERAYRFLLTGRQIGYPPEKLENATALLAIAAQQSGANEDAAVYYQDLTILDPAWENPQTLESLEWPEELKASLRQLVW